MKKYNAAVNDAQAAYFTSLISQSTQNLKVLLKTLDRSVGAPP